MPLWWLKPLAIALALAGIFGAGWHTRGVRADRDAAQVQLTAAESARAAERGARTQEQQRTQRVQEIADADRKNLSVRLRAAQSAAAAAVGLRDDAAAAVSAAASDPAATGGSASATGPGLVLADVLGRCGSRLAELAAAVDASRAAGLTCERAYDAVRE